MTQKDPRLALSSTSLLSVCSEIMLKAHYLISKARVLPRPSRGTKHERAGGLGISALSRKRTYSGARINFANVDARYLQQSTTNLQQGKGKRAKKYHVPNALPSTILGPQSWIGAFGYLFQNTPKGWFLAEGRILFAVGNTSPDATGL